MAAFHGYAFPSDPAAAGIALEAVTYASPAGDLDAWYLRGDGGTWVIAVHGRGETRPELFCMVEAIADPRYRRSSCSTETIRAPSVTTTGSRSSVRRSGRTYS